MLNKILADPARTQEIAGKVGGGGGLFLAAMFGLAGAANLLVTPMVVITIVGLAACVLLVVISTLPARWLTK